MLESIIEKIALNGTMGLMAAIFIIIAIMLYKSFVRLQKEREIEYRETIKEVKAELHRMDQEFKDYRKNDREKMIAAIETSTKSIEQNTRLMHSINKNLDRLEQK